MGKLSQKLGVRHGDGPMHSAHGSPKRFPFRDAKIAAAELLLTHMSNRDQPSSNHHSAGFSHEFLSKTTIMNAKMISTCQPEQSHHQNMHHGLQRPCCRSSWRKTPKPSSSSGRCRRKRSSGSTRMLGVKVFGQGWGRPWQFPHFFPRHFFMVKSLVVGEIYCNLFAGPPWATIDLY